MAAEIIRTAPHRIGVAGAFLLISASASLGAFYGFTVGSHVHWLVGLVFAGAALGGELLKPFAVAHALAAFRAREFMAGLACTVLALACVVYSIASELSLAAGSRGDMASERRHTAEQSSVARERRERAVAELQTLRRARSPEELAPLIAKLLATRGANGCEQNRSAKSAREACAKVSEFRSEAARWQQRAELERRIASAEAALVSAPVAAADADPLASALAAYANALGSDMTADTLVPWLALIPVLFLEIGSALALVVLKPLPASPVLTPSAPMASRRSAEHATAASATGQLPVPPPIEPPASERPAGERTECPKFDCELSARVIEYLNSRGGRVFAGQRQLANALGISKSRVHELLHDMSARGRIALETSRRGTMVALLN